MAAQAAELYAEKKSSRQVLGWDTKKAFGVMVESNKHYWKKISDFNDAACGVVKATLAMQKKYPRETV